MIALWSKLFIQKCFSKNGIAKSYPKKNLSKESWEMTSGTTKWEKLGQVEYVGQVGQGERGLQILVWQVGQGEVSSDLRGTSGTRTRGLSTWTIPLVPNGTTRPCNVIQGAFWSQVCCESHLWLVTKNFYFNFFDLFFERRRWDTMCCLVAKCADTWCATFFWCMRLAGPLVTKQLPTLPRRHRCSAAIVLAAVCVDTTTLSTILQSYLTIWTQARDATSAFEGPSCRIVLPFSGTYDADLLFRCRPVVDFIVQSLIHRQPAR